MRVTDSLKLKSAVCKRSKDLFILCMLSSWYSSFLTVMARTPISVISFESIFSQRRNVVYRGKDTAKKDTDEYLHEIHSRVGRFLQSTEQTVLGWWESSTRGLRARQTTAAKDTRRWFLFSMSL